MENKDILKHLKDSINDAPIDILDNIKSAEVVKMDEHDEITRQENISGDKFNNKSSNMLNFPNRKTLVSLASLAAIFLVVFIGYYQLRIPDSQVYIDVNPSISITTNKRDKVIELEAINEGSKKIIEDIDYKNKDLEEVTGEVIKALALDSNLSSTYLDDEESVLLLSVYNNNTDKRDSQAERLDGLVREQTASYDMDPVILTQTIDKTNTVEEYAEQYGVSVGKMTFIRNLIILDPELKTEDLVKLSLYELLEISINTGIDIDSIVNSGDDDRVHTQPSTSPPTPPPTQAPTERPTQAPSSTPTNPSYNEGNKSERKPISLEEAKRIALSKTNGGQIVDIEQDDDEFEFEIVNGNLEYRVDLNLYGDVIKLEMETIDDDNDRDDDRDGDDEDHDDFDDQDDDDDD